MAPPAEIAVLRHNDNLLASSVLASKSAITTEIHSITDDDLAQPSTLVLNPAFITQEFDLLRFEAAAYNQLPSSNTTPSTPDSDLTSPSPAYSPFLISSPYNNPGHYLNLTSLTTPSLLFAQALTALKPTRPDYATAPYTESLNFDHVLSVLQGLLRETGFTWLSTSFYVVVFRSKLNAGVDQTWLYKLDYESHGEACESGGLLKYWFGKADEGRRNLATCEFFFPFFLLFIAVAVAVAVLSVL
jgi:hypothetical protein